VIHSTAVINPKAELDSDVSVGPYALIEGDVRIGSGTEIQGHAVISGQTYIGKKIESATVQSFCLFRKI
jgi:UDP-N-acetylglucosamine acyltransferase